ncbi:hypothetical protein IMZ31_19655 (plasmid) [Pontibacillus sp. ALD_SL1]|uniref:hypothetical protein n=1 Tax=Pontibacillus sp. ALD_SL1 TaxID=2777185 RepID=UPI001A964B22|nr:hypothetical protein [Pontibacillus sp. ALD_SL1]QST02768.1 hypothetical protein IMZ31_19655 [Pontibacillus sp. ALD_SL1]
MKNIEAALREVFNGFEVEVTPHYFEAVSSDVAISGFKCGREAISVFFDTYVSDHKEKRVHHEMKTLLLRLASQLEGTCVKTLEVYDNRNRTECSMVLSTDTVYKAVRKKQRKEKVKGLLVRLPI